MSRDLRCPNDVGRGAAREGAMTRDLPAPSDVTTTGGSRVR
jgi:hypothetical protein